ncbi:MAG: hypothetical protein JM58_06040 [Peptococcaceae bacterium BICA1-8]|nr:MAG: hypothetical protein JM58_06040 [Peptococcaceae bacterium BICA1-8]
MTYRAERLPIIFIPEQSLVSSMGNIFVKTDPAEKSSRKKRKSPRELTRDVALIMALDRAIRHGGGGGSVYDGRGILVL